MTAQGEDLNLEATELRLGLPGTVEPEKQQAPLSGRSMKRNLIDVNNEYGSNEEESNGSSAQKCDKQDVHRPSKAQVVGWPPVRSYRKNCFQKKVEGESTGVFIKVSMDGAPYLRKIDLKPYKGYSDLLKDLQDMFKFKVGDYCEREGYNGSEFVPTYEDKDGDWMLVGDVPWNMFITSCKRLRIMKGSSEV